MKDKLIGCIQHDCDICKELEAHVVTLTRERDGLRTTLLIHDKLFDERDAHIEALERIYIEGCHHNDTYAQCGAASTALRATIAEAEKCEPVAWSYRSKISGNETLTHQPPDRVIEPEQFHIQPLYTHPAPVPAGWQPIETAPLDSKTPLAPKPGEES